MTNAELLELIERARLYLQSVKQDNTVSQSEDSANQIDYEPTDTGLDNKELKGEQK